MSKILLYCGMCFTFKPEYSVSDIDLEIRDVWEKEMEKEPTEAEVQEVWKEIERKGILCQKF
jgi:hypothetical protein